MGRYYTGDINGKFWFGVQSSDDAEQFGATERSSAVLLYEADDLDACKARLLDIFEQLGVTPNLHMTEDEVESLAEKDSEERQHLYASLELGLKMYQCIEKNGACFFEAEL